MISPLDDKRFIIRGNFCNEQAPSAEVIYNDAVLTQIPQETKHRDTISSSTLNNSSQTQECNLPDVLVDS